METQKTTHHVSMPEIHPNPCNPVERLLYIDNIRWLMIVLVVLIHLNCTYGNIGRWYYLEPGPVDVFSRTFFSLFGCFTQAYFMGFLFLIAGFFVPGACDRKGSRLFVGDRFKRLGIPTLVFMLFLTPLIFLIMFAFNHNFPANPIGWYLGYLTSSGLLEGTGPLWFTLALLFFSTLYALLRLVFPQSKAVAAPENAPTLTHWQILMWIVLIALGNFTVRFFQPIGTAFLNMQLCYFSQYIILFCLGIVVYRRNLLSALPSKLGRFWLGLAFQVGIPLWVILMLVGDATNNWSLFAGGLHWQAAGYAVWEAFICVSVCLGLLVVFRDNYNSQNRFSRFLSENAFGVYVFHTPIMVAATMLVRPIVIYPVLKMLLMSIILLPVCFGFSHLVRKVPLMKRYFS